MTDSLDLLAELTWRGLLQDQSDGLAARLSRGPISGYNGFDPSGPSLHVGNLVPVFGLMHLQRAGGRPVILVGGGTGMIGDPSGKSAERNLLDRAALEANRARIRVQLERFLDFSAGPSGALMLDNLEWLGSWGLLDFLRDIGKHFTLSYMLGKESVQTRLQAGISFTEFSYMTLQAADFLHLYREHGVELQTGGADQWGNITAGLELIRRVEGGEEDGDPLAYGLSYPLLLSPSGEKFGKTEKGSVFLDPEKTSPFDFYQFFLNQDDGGVARLLRTLTLMTSDEVRELEKEQAAHPEDRPAQRALAHDITARVHGREEAERQVTVARAAFSGEPLRDPSVIETLYGALDRFEFGDPDVRDGALGLIVASGAYPSRSAARRAIEQGAVRINDERISDPDQPVPEPIAGEWLVVRAGRRHLRIGRRRG
ncbi:MAG TPA: tyrosine--tRNA ligase [Candidatus Limnocylindrales bacterium]|jgi:tyrosyl-tRNA synthetase|nr:tyrosine--tRNA ligase [Candidatus Limnocylindrales bacterium]